MQRMDRDVRGKVWKPYEKNRKRERERDIGQEVERGEKGSEFKTEERGKES